MKKLSIKIKNRALSLTLCWVLLMLMPSDSFQPFKIACHFAGCHFVEFHFAECHFAECHFAECHFAECLGAKHLKYCFDKNW
jgi:hypothetical protein